MGAFELVGRSGDIIVLLGIEAYLNDEARDPVGWAPRGITSL